MTFSPMPHQAAALVTAHQRLRYGWFWKPGVGKTLAMYMVCRESPMATLVVAPKTLVRSAWGVDAGKIGLPVTIYQGDADKRKKMRQSLAVDDRAIVVTNFDTYRVDAKHFQEAGFQRVIVDESSMVRNRGTKNFQTLLPMADRARSYYGLSGEPAPNGPDNYWAQLRLISARPDGPAGVPGGFTPPDFWRWAAWWLVTIKKRVRVWVKLPGGDRRQVEKEVIVGFRLNPGREAQFRAMLAEWSQVLYAEDCLSLPPETPIAVPVELSKPERAAYMAVARDLAYIDDAGERHAFDSHAKHMKLRQISGGHLRLPDGAWQTLGGSKIDALLDLVAGLGNEPMVVWTQFHQEADAVAATMAKIGRSVVVCDGRQSDNSANIARFVAGEARTIVAHPRSVGHGTTLHTCGAEACRYDVFYSLDYDWDYHGQALKRLHRAGQRYPVFHYYLLADGTADAAVLEALLEKRDESAVTLAAVRAIKRILEAAA